MAFKGITFAGQNVTPKNDGGLYQAHYGDGILWGCSMAISGDDLVIQSGEFIAGGRVCFVDGATNVDLSGRVNTTGYIQVIMNYDLSQGEGSQWYTSFVESATTTFPDLTQDDINDTGTLYQLALAIVQVSGGNLTSVYSTSVSSPLITRDLNNNTATRWFTGSGGAGFRHFNNGVAVGGCSVYDGGSTYLYNEGTGVIIRPNGLNDSSGQVRYTTQGQQIGGHLVSNANKTTPTSAGSGLNTTAVTLTGLDSGGIYVVSGWLAYTPTSTSGIYPRLTLTGNLTSHLYYFNGFSNSSASKNLSICGVCTGNTEYSLVLNIAGGGSISEAHITGVRIA